MNFLPDDPCYPVCKASNTSWILLLDFLTVTQLPPNLSQAHPLFFEFLDLHYPCDVLDGIASLPTCSSQRNQYAFKLLLPVTKGGLGNLQLQTELLDREKFLLFVHKNYGAVLSVGDRLLLLELHKGPLNNT